MKTASNQLLVIFGASGDLTGRKLLPSLYELHVRGLLPERFCIRGRPVWNIRMASTALSKRCISGNP